MAEKTKVEVMRSAFESKYGAPANDNKKVLIGMKGGKAVYGDELDAVDTTGAQYVGTYSQNQAILSDLSKEKAQSGGMYNPSAKDIAAAEQMSPVTAADKTVTKRADGTEMVGAYSPQAAAMREKTTADNQFASTLARLNARPNRTSIGAAGKLEAPASPATPASPETTTRPTILPFPEYSTEDAINKISRPTILPFPEFSTEDAINNATNDNANYLTGLINKRKKNSPLNSLTMV